MVKRGKIVGRTPGNIYKCKNVCTNVCLEYLYLLLYTKQDWANQNKKKTVRVDEETESENYTVDGEELEKGEKKHTEEDGHR